MFHILILFLALWDTTYHENNYNGKKRTLSSLRLAGTIYTRKEKKTERKHLFLHSEMINDLFARYYLQRLKIKPENGSDQ